MMEKIRGRVAKILNARELLINRGSADGVEVGMRFAVLDPEAENVKDPDTGDSLGSIFRPKVSVEVTEVEPHLSLAATYRKSTVNIGGGGALASSALSKLFEPPNYVERYETFRSSEQTWEALPESQSFVKVGDPIVQVVATTSAQTGLAGADLTGARLTKDPLPTFAHPSSAARRRRAARPQPDPAAKPQSETETVEGERPPAPPESRVAKP